MASKVSAFRGNSFARLEIQQEMEQIREKIKATHFKDIKKTSKIAVPHIFLLYHFVVVLITKRIHKILNEFSHRIRYNHMVLRQLEKNKNWKKVYREWKKSDQNIRKLFEQLRELLDFFFEEKRVITQFRIV